MKQKLELTWIGKENRPKLEPRILLEDPAKLYHVAHRVTENDIFENMERASEFFHYPVEPLMRER